MHISRRSNNKNVLHSLPYKTVQERFEQEAARNPNATAIKFGKKTLSYKQVDDKANQFASQLLQLGVTPNKIVALFLDRSPNLVIAILAVLKAGGAFVILNTESPETRINYLIKNSDALILTEKKFEQNFPEENRLVLEDKYDSLESDKQPVIPFVSIKTANHLACIRYVPNIKNEPDGVSISHKGLINCLSWISKTLNLSNSDIFVLAHQPDQSQALLEILIPLFVGGTLLVPTKTGTPPELINLIKKNRVTSLLVHPTLLKKLLDEELLSSCSSLKYVICNGETLSYDLIKGFFEQLEIDLYNCYGTSETTFYSTYFPYKKATISFHNIIGKPISNTKCYVVDEQGHSVKDGEVGEILIAGDGLAQGYLHSSERTHEHFIANTIDTDAANSGYPVLFRTGDFGRYLSDGNLEFIERRDRQVKLDGNRIELEEIEFKLKRCSDVHDALVVLVEENGEKNLVSYIIPDLKKMRIPFDEEVTIDCDGQAFKLKAVDLSLGGICVKNLTGIAENALIKIRLPQGYSTDALEVEGKVVWRKDNLCGIQFEQSIDQAAIQRLYESHRSSSDGSKLLCPTVLSHRNLRYFLKEVLPQSSIHVASVWLEKFPRNEHNQIDLKSLPLPNYRLREKKYIAPRNMIESYIAEVVYELFNIKNISVDDDFLLMGGDSILAMQLIARLQKKYHVTFTLDELFHNPSVEDIAELVQERMAKTILKPLLPVTRQPKMPLSIPAARLWFLNKLNPGTAVYNVASAYTVQGPIDSKLLASCFDYLVNRHEALRTEIREQNGVPYQVIVSKATIDFNFHDLSSKDKDLAELEAEELLFQAAQSPLSIENAPLARTALIKITTNMSYFVLVLHKIIADEWSLQVLLKELCELYAAWQQNETVNLKPLSLQYYDYAAWQKDFLTDEIITKDLDYWKTALSDVPALINLPTDYSRPAHIGSKSLTIFFTIPAKLTKQLKRYAREQKVTLFMLMLASYQVLLHRYTGDTDILIGTEISGRTLQDIEQMIGYFTNTLVLRADLTGNPSFEDFLLQVRDTTLAAYDHQNVPFEVLLDHLKIERSLSHSPLFQVMFQSKLSEDKPLQFGKAQAYPQFITNAATQHDVITTVSERNQCLYLEIKINSELYKSSSVQRTFLHWKNLLTELIRKPHGKIGEFNILTEDERNQVLHSFNMTKHYFPQRKTITQLFEDQVKRTPQSTALVYRHTSLTYLELNRRTNQFAQYLFLKGYKPGTKIAVCLSRNADLVVALMGIFKAGCTYIPLDPKYPSERINVIASDSGAAVLITEENLIGLVSFEGKTIDIESIIKESAKLATENIGLSQDGNDTAYIIYTSGSTGKPKGVLLNHRNLVNFISWSQNSFSIQECERLLAATSINFDLSIFELFFPLTIGGTVVIADNLFEISEWWDKNITLINTVPSVMKSLLKLDMKLPSSVKTINLAGEPLERSLVQELYSLSAAEKIYNLYGPTETTTYSTFTLIRKAKIGHINIGRPIANTEVYIFDKYLNLLPRGCIGEIYIAGEGVSKGYLNRPDLNQERFLDNPFSYLTEHPTNKMYKTGDLGRYLPDGSIDYAGRSDFQVKIHGFRIELGELENCLAKHPSIKEVVVIVREDKPDDKRLVAYIVLNRREDVEIDFYSYLKNLLPEYMIPNSFVVLDEIPLSPNGKIDRKALPIPELVQVLGKHVPPRSKTENELVHLWKEILEIEEVGIYDNFFEVGGHSLLVTQLAYHIRTKYNFHLSFGQFFNNPTIVMLASMIDEKSNIQKLESTLADIEKDLLTARTLLPPKGELAPAKDPKTILLTGVSGFLGIHLLNELITSTKANIYCLIRPGRGKPIQEAFNEHASAYQFTALIDHPRIILVPGDLDSDNFGLSQTEWQKFTTEIDTIYHLAAFVHHLFDYSTLRGPNVEGTIKLLKLASEGKQKRIHYVSTIWAALDKDNELVLEQFPETKPTGFEDGYCLTKWTSEKILSEAKDRGFAVTIYRPSFILGHSKTGVIPTKNLHILLLLKGCIQMGFAPKGLGVLNSMPVDYVAKMTTSISLKEQSLNQVFNVVESNPPSLEQVFTWLRNSGFPMKFLPFEEWRDDYLSKIDEDNALYPIAALYVNEEVPSISAANIRHNNSKQVLQKQKFDVPTDKELYLKYFKYLKEWFSQ